MDLILDRHQTPAPHIYSCRRVTPTSKYAIYSNDSPAAPEASISPPIVHLHRRAARYCTCCFASTSDISLTLVRIWGDHNHLDVEFAFACPVCDGLQKLAWA